MYTQCPECLTVFALTQQQLDARAGVVRCGQCAAIFQADEHMVDTLLENNFEQVEVSLPPTSQAPAGDVGDEAPEDTETSLTTGSSNGGRRKPGRRLWAFINFLLLITLIGQCLYLYRGELAQQPRLALWITEACEFLGCEIPSPQDIGKIELIDAEVAPHPKFDKALRIKASLVNHADFVQDYPLMEISLTNNNGVVIARRTFSPQEYLEKPRTAVERMAPNITVSALLEITHPDDSAVGYEIQLLTPPS